MEHLLIESFFIANGDIFQRIRTVFLAVLRVRPVLEEDILVDIFDDSTREKTPRPSYVEPNSLKNQNVQTRS